MDFTELNEKIPLCKGEELYFLTAELYPHVSIAMPGRHQYDTPIKGADFVVRVTDVGKMWTNHHFTHNDIFRDVGEKAEFFDEESMAAFMGRYYSVVVEGVDPLDLPAFDGGFTGIDPNVFIFAAQALAVAEHRRYAAFEPQGGGRYLPLRMAAGIAEGLWTAKDAAAVQRRGRMGLEHLESVHGESKITQRMRNAKVMR